MEKSEKSTQKVDKIKNPGYSETVRHYRAGSDHWQSLSHSTFPVRSDTDGGLNGVSMYFLYRIIIDQTLADMKNETREFLHESAFPGLKKDDSPMIEGNCNLLSKGEGKIASIEGSDVIKKILDCHNDAIGKWKLEHNNASLILQVVLLHEV